MERIKGKDVAFVLSAALFMAIVDVLFYLLIDGNPLKSLLILEANYMMALAFWVVLYLSSLIHLRICGKKNCRHVLPRMLIPCSLHRMKPHRRNDDADAENVL